VKEITEIKIMCTKCNTYGTFTFPIEKIDTKKIITLIEKTIGEEIMDSIKVKRIFAHNDFSSHYNTFKGTALGLAHTLSQTAIYRPQHESKKIKNLYYTGHYNHPGIGVPMVIISSQILTNIINNSNS